MSKPHRYAPNRVSLKFTDRHYWRLKDLADETGLLMSEIIEQALDYLFESHESTEEDEPGQGNEQ